jgi:arylsulfatase A-like enzyme
MENARGFGVSGGLALASAAWVAFAVIHLALSFLAPRGILQDPLLPAGARWALFSMELVAQAGAVAVAGALFALLGLLKKRWLAVLGRGVLAAALLLGLAASWAAFWLSAQFLDGEGLGFCAANLGQLYLLAARMHPILVHGGPLLLAAAAAASCIFLPRLFERLPFRARIGLATGGILLAGLSALAASKGGAAFREDETKVADPATGVIYAPRELYRLRREQGAGPLVHAGARLFGRGGGDEAGLPPAASPDLILKPIRPMEEYLASIDRAKANRWNVVVILVDSLRADQLRDYGCPRDVMPAVNALARESRAFPDCYTQAGHTDYAVPGIFSSHYPLRARDVYRHPRSPTWPRVMIWDILKGLGYRTAFFSSQNEEWGQAAGYLRTGGLDRYSYPGASSGTQLAGTVDDRVTVSEALSWIDEPGDAPFFLALFLQSAHVPYEIPADFPRRFGPREIGFTISAGHFPREKAEAVKDIYADSLAYADTQVERLLGRLRSGELWGRTVVAVSGDHGESFYEHGSAAHANGLYEETMRVPLVMRAPGLEPGRDPRPAQLIDLAPSLLRLLGIPPHPGFQGMDLFESGFPADRSRFLVSDTPWMTQSAVVRSGFKLVHDPRLGRGVLYDLLKDPEEKAEITADRPALAEELAGRLAEWRRAQLEYYGNPLRHGLEYPPVLRRP